jgi:Raf kinase inhibitor-like YbhB/YbcL family protein
MQLQSNAFAAEDSIPRRYTKDGENISPPLHWSDLPPGTKELALVLLDTKARDPRPFTHWLIYGIDPALDELPEGISHRRSPAANGDEQQLHQGRNDLENVGYDGPQPPLGPAHEYHFRLYALDASLPAEAGLARPELESHLRGHVLDEAELVAYYARPD